MLDDLSSKFVAEKRKDLTSRLKSKNDPRQIIGAEIELSAFWALNQICDLSVDPAPLSDGSRPDAYSQNLFFHPAYVEVTAISDESLSDEGVMRRACTKITNFVNGYRRGFGRHLHYQFAEHSGWEGNVFRRERRVSSSFELTEADKTRLTQWVDACKAGFASPLRILNNEVDVTIVRHFYKQHQLFNFHSSMPPIAYSIKENPAWRALEEKERQLARVSEGELRCILLADAGCDPLRNLHRRDPSGLVKSGAQIVQEFMRDTKLDFIIVMSAQRRGWNRWDEQLEWQFTPFCKSKEVCAQATKVCGDLTRVLPTPRFEGYQVRTLQQQGLFSPQGRGWYVGGQMSSNAKDERIVLKVSSRLLQEFLAGRVSIERFQDGTFGRDGNLISHWLSMGYTIANVSMEKLGIDEDDDRVVMEFSLDPAAKKFE